MKQFLNIALLGRDFSWGGGRELLRYIANALLSVTNDRQIKLFLLMPTRSKVDPSPVRLSTIQKIVAKIISQRKSVSPRLKPNYDFSLPDFLKNVEGKIEIVEYNEAGGLIPALQKIKADVALPANSPLGHGFPFPWVGYIFDFQHKYIPDYFTARECLNRDIFFATMLRDAKAVIVNSRSVKDDIDKFFPYCECQVFNLPFSASPVKSWLEETDPNNLESYNLPDRYFLISNQFWIHKSHSTAFQALSLLLNTSNCSDIHIVCTGKMEDFRCPDYIQNLQQEVRDLGIEHKIHFLGHIPKIDQIAIMKKSIAVLQPTLFEGGPGGGSAYDAVSLGVPVILSDIPVNREIENEENLFYFQTNSAADLAERMKEFLKMNIRKPPKNELILRGERRKRHMGESLLAAVKYVMKKSSTVEV